MSEFTMTLDDVAAAINLIEGVGAHADWLARVQDVLNKHDLGHMRDTYGMEIYGAGGWNRYFLYHRGGLFRLVFSTGHLSYSHLSERHKALHAVQALGIRLTHPCLCHECRQARQAVA